MIQNKYARKYCRQVRKWLPGIGRYKCQIMERIYSAVSVFVEENPETDYIALKKHFGTPQQIAAVYVEEMDTQTLLRSLRVKRRIVTTVMACAAILILMWSFGISLMILDAHKSTHGYMEVEYNDGRKGVMVEWEE